MSACVFEEGGLLGHIQNLKYHDYNLRDPEKFPQFQTDQYMCKKIEPMTKAKVLAPQAWIEKLAPLGLLNLLCIPHFRRSLELNAVVKVLLSCVHHGYLWLYQPIDLNVDVIHRITGLSKVGAHPSTHFVDKNLDRKQVAKLMKEFKFSKGTRAYDFADIHDQALRFIVQLLAGHILRKCRPNQVPIVAIELTM